MNTPRLHEFPRMTGGGMYVSKIIDDNTVELKHIYAPWIVVVAKVIRFKNELFCL